MTVTDLQPGSIVGIAGPVIDAEFPPGELPEINTALEFDVELDGVETTIVAEVAQQIGENRIRAIAMKHLTWSNALRSTGKELVIGFLNGILFSIFLILNRRI